jgi:hypothetical protein
MRLAAVGIRMLIMLSGWVTGGLAGCSGGIEPDRNARDPNPERKLIRSADEAVAFQAETDEHDGGDERRSAVAQHIVVRSCAQHATNAPRGYEGATGRFTFTRVGNGRFTVSKADYIPTLVTRYQPGRPARLYQVATALKTAKGSFRNRLLDAQRHTSAVVMRKDPQGLTMG